MRDVIDELDASLNDTLTFDFDTEEAPRERAGQPDGAAEHIRAAASSRSCRRR